MTKRYIMYVGTGDEDYPVTYVGNVNWESNEVVWERDEHFAGLFTGQEVDTLLELNPDFLAEKI